MAKLSRNQRKLVGEAVRQTIANLGFIGPAKQADYETGIGHSNDETEHKKAQTNFLFDAVTELLTGITGILFSIFSASIINYFGQFPKILNFGVWGISALLILGASKMVWLHKRHWIILGRVFKID